MPHLIIFAALLFCALVASCVLTACQPLVRPFQPEEKTNDDAMFRIRDAGGIVLRKLEGMPEGTGDALAGALLKGLEKLEIPATAVVSAANRRSLFLDAEVRTAPVSNSRLAIEIDWKLTNVEGHVVGEHRVAGEVQRALWGKPGEQPYAMLAERSLPGIAALVQDPAAVATPADDPDRRKLFVWPVAGAPGKGGPALSRAMDNALRAARLPVAEEMTDDALVIAGSVHLGPAEKGRQRLEIVWTVLEAGGREIAKLAQANVVEEGSLNGDWGPLARIIADAAVPGVVDLLRQLPARAELKEAPSGG